MKSSIQLEQLICQLQFNYKYVLDLVEDVDENSMTFSPAKGLENHPTFTIGHLITAYGLTMKRLGGQYTVKKEWDEIFRRNGPGDPRLPTADKNTYPTKEELLSELGRQHDILLEYLGAITEKQLNENITWRLSSHFPKTIDFIYFIAITHYSMHLGQLAAWRRAMDLPSSLARL